MTVTQQVGCELKAVPFLDLLWLKANLLGDNWMIN